MKRVFDIVLRAQTAALAAARPGVECGAIDAAARKVVTDGGYGPDYKYFTHRLGHGMGMDGHEWPYLVRGNPTRLQANMTTSNEPGIYIRGEFGIRIEDDMHIMENGAELFTPKPVVAGRTVRKRRDSRSWRLVTLGELSESLRSAKDKSEDAAFAHIRHQHRTKTRDAGSACRRTQG